MDEEISEIWVTKFDEEHAQKFRVSVQAAIKGDPNKPIIVYIDSYGGFVDALAKMIETLDEVPNPVITACMGKAMSCGAILLSHGDVRFLGPNSRIMIHEVSSAASGNVQDMKEDVKETIRMNEHFMGLLARNCGFKNYAQFRDVIKQQDGRDRYLHTHEAIKFGIVDAVGMPKVVAKVLYEVTKQPVKTPEASRNKQAIVNGKTSSKIKKSETRKR